MPIQKVEYEFPDPDQLDAAAEIEVSTPEETSDIEVEGAVGREVMQKPKKEPREVKVVEDKNLEVEVVDDTPEADRGRKPSKPPEEITDDELENYSEKVKKRIQHFSKGYHDERRIKEDALRQKEEAIAYAQQLVAENKKLKTEGDTTHNAFVATAKNAAEAQLASAKRAYKQAYDSGETDAIVEAQTELNAAQIRADKVGGIKPRAVVKPEATLQPQQNTVQSQENRTQAPVKDEKAEAWQKENTWFGSNDEMTALALGLHNKLTREGTSPQSDQYYEKINSRMREVFPDEFDEGIEDEPETPKRKSSNVVAPATRSTKPNKVTLSQTQVALAKRLGVPLEDYAQQVADLRGNTNG